MKGISLKVEDIQSAWEGSSFTPEKRANQFLADCDGEINRLYNEMLEFAKTEEQRAILETEINKYIEGYKIKIMPYLNIRSKTVSPMIVGSAKFPVSRMQKLHSTEDKRYDEFSAWNKRAKKAIKIKIIEARSTEQVFEDNWRWLKQEIDSCMFEVAAIDMGKSFYTRSAFTNSVAGKLRTLAKYGNAKLIETNLSYIKAEQGKSPKPFFSPKNTIWQLVETAQAQANKEQEEAKTGQETLFAIGNIEVVNNFDDERIRIYFPGKPETEIMQKLKSSGWKWSPYNKAWQRKNTTNAIYSAKYILEEK